jgi:hypothetical protein
LTPQEKEEGPEGHYDGEGNPTTPELAHYGHTTIDGSRYDYQKQHILHPRMVAVPYEEKILDDAGKPTGQTRIAHKMIPTDSRFRDEDVLAQQLQQTGQKRFKSKNGKYPGVILMTTPTESTSNAGHQTEFTHHVDQDSVTHALANNGEYEIDNPQAQIASANKPYAAPKELKFAPKKFAFGGMVGDVGDEMDDYMDDDHHLGLPEQNYKSQQHIMHRERPENISHSHHQLHKNVANIDQAMQLVAKLRRHNPPGRR